MSSGLASIPKTAPFSEEDVALLNRVVGPASAVQRAWLAGFLAGVESATGQQAQPAAPARPAEPLTIVYASESGNSEKLAGDIAKAARKNGLKPTIIDMADLELPALTSAKRLVVIAATWGEGDPPARAVRTYNELMGEGAPRLDGVEFGVLALATRPMWNSAPSARRSMSASRLSAASASSTASIAISISLNLRRAGSAMR